MEIIGPLQVRVMHHIWRKGASTVHEVHDAVNAEPGAKQLAYTTILTVMRNLVRRGFLGQKPEGRAHRFNAKVDERTYKLDMVRHIRKELFAGDVDQLLAYVAQDEEIPATKRDAVARLGAGSAA